jgi:4'-phosphopantetheinyl transferase EntD
MKTNENSIINFKKNSVEFFLSKKIEWKESEVPMTQEEIGHYSTIQNLERKNEFLGVRFLRNIFDSQLEIKYLENGKPIDAKGIKYISISHSKNHVAFSVSPHPIGVDIEEIHERIINVRDRFLNHHEKELFDRNSIQELTIAWCAKETLFKLNEDSGLDFKTDLIIKSWDKESTILAIMKENSKWIEVNLYYEIKDNVVLCFNFE